MKRLLLAVLLLAPLTASAQTLPKQAGYKLCEPGATGSDCVTVGPMGAITGSPACIPESDSTPYDTCVTAPTAVPTATPQPTPTPIPPGGSSGNLQTNNGSGGFGAYAGSACPTPGMVISTNASGAHTCATPVPPTPVPTATPGSGTGDITDVMDCASGDCSTITAGASDVLDMAAALRTSACKVGTSAPGTCTVGDCFFDSDATAGANLFGCTATNTWTAQGGGAAGKTYFSASTGATNLATNTTPIYFAASGISTPNTTESSIRLLLPVGQVSDFWCRLFATPDNGGATQSYTFNLRVGAADSTLEATISEADVTFAAIDTDVVAIGATGTQISIESTAAGTPTARSALCFWSFVAS